MSTPVSMVSEEMICTYNNMQSFLSKTQHWYNNTGSSSWCELTVLFGQVQAGLLSYICFDYPAINFLYIYATQGSVFKLPILYCHKTTLWQSNNEYLVQIGVMVMMKLMLSVL